jgi:hypothetical protein
MKVRIITSYADHKGDIHKEGDVVELEDREAVEVLNSGAAKPASSRAKVDADVESAVERK